MQEGPCIVHGGTPRQREAVRALCIAATDELGYAGPISAEIRDDRTRPAHVEASASDEGVWISAALAGNGARLPWVLYEEVAHYVLAKMARIPHGGTFVEVLLHELYATWFQLRVFVEGGVVTWDDMVTTPMPAGGETPEVGYHLGKHIAATAMGSAANRAHLERWLSDDSVDARLRQFASALLDSLPVQGSPTELAAAVAEVYRGARAESPC